MDLQIDMITEQEITKLLEMQKMITDKMGIDTSQDRELPKMLQRVDADKIEESLEKQFWAKLTRADFVWSGRWDLNPRPSPWEGDILPLNYARTRISIANRHTA